MAISPRACVHSNPLALLKNPIPPLVQKLRHLQGSPPSLAKGTAIGVFIGIAPLMPFKSILIVLITLATGSSSVAAFLVCAIICNPLTYIPLYYLAWLVGTLFLPGMVRWETIGSTVDRMQQVGLGEAIGLLGRIGFDAGAVLLAGGCIVALPLAFVSYPLALRLFLRRERKGCDQPSSDRNRGESGPDAPGRSGKAGTRV